MHRALRLIYYSTLYISQVDLNVERTTRMYFYLFSKRTSHFLHFGNNAHLPQANGELGLT